MTLLVSRARESGTANSMARIFTRYTAGSLLAAGVSEVTLLAGFGLAHLGPHLAAMIAWASGAVVNYLSNRYWAWRRRGPAHPLKELLPYWATAVASLLLATWATGAAATAAAHLGGTPRTLVVGGVYLATYGGLFLAKFVFFHYVLFAERVMPGSTSREGPRPPSPTAGSRA